MSFRALGVLAGSVLLVVVACGGDHPAGSGAVSASGAVGYVLFSPLLSGTTYLIDRAGRVVHTWQSEFAPGVSSLLLDNGHLLRTARKNGTPALGNGGDGGRIQEFGWNGELVWEWVVDGDDVFPHHDTASLPNGNIFLIAWERKSRDDAIRAGRDPGLVDAGGLWPDALLEIRPERPRGGRSVWEWHVWDHLIQDRDRRRENYGRVSDHPELVDINGSRPEGFTDEAIRKLKALGYLVGGGGRSDRLADFMHTNSVAYNPQLDQIALSVWGYNEIWILDHGTTTRETASHSGGRTGRGGDLLYRWGNPRVYGRGTDSDRRLFGQHDARWIPRGFPGEGNLTVFNNGVGRPETDYSSVLEIEPPLGPDGRYTIAAGRPFGPERPAWEYTASTKGSFLADFISGAQRLPDGNTLVCDGPNGRLFEVTPRGETIWEFESPYSGDAPNPHGDPPRSIFRATFVRIDHPALAGRDLRPLDPQPPHQASVKRHR
jgi:hypothetical protein